MNGFDLKMEQIHNDTTSVMVRGAYNGQNAKAVQLKRGHSKERRPDLKQLVYSLCVTADGAVPVHYRNERIERTRERLETLDLKRMRGPKTEAAIRKRVDQILAQHHAEEWIAVEVKWDAVERFKAITRGKPTADTTFRRIIQHVPRLHVSTKAENIAQSAAMDGIFPLTTNTKEKPIDVFKIYKYQPRIEKRHALLKSTLEVAPIWLKKNTRIEALMFLEFIAQMVAALIERELRHKMTKKKIDLLCSLPEGRASKTPTIDQVLRLFENQNKHALYDGDRLIKQFADPLTPVQSQILQLLSIPTAVYGPGK
jgi:transposase